MATNLSGADPSFHHYREKPPERQWQGSRHDSINFMIFLENSPIGQNLLGLVLLFAIIGEGYCNNL
jgi:hypothetical protein